MIRSQDLAQLLENLHSALSAVNYSLFNFDLYRFISQCLYCPLYPPSLLLIFSPVSVERLFTAFHPVFALKVCHAALLQDPGVTFERGKALLVCKKTIREKHCRSVRKPSENEGDSPARELVWIYFHAVFAWAENDGAHKIWHEAMLNVLGRRKCS